MDFRVSGTSPLAQFYSFSASFTRTLSDLTEALFSGDSVGDAVAARGLDLGVPIGLTVADFATSSAIGELLEGAAEREAQQAAQGIGLEIEDDLNAKIHEALELDENGRRTFVIDQEFARLLTDGVTLDDLLVAAR